MQHNRQFKKYPKTNNPRNKTDSDDNDIHEQDGQITNNLGDPLDDMSDGSRQNFSDTGQYASYELQIHPQEELLDEILFEEKKTYKDHVSEELENKLKELKSTLRGKDIEEVLNIRMHELAISKILVLTHGKSSLILVIAHAHIGEAYIDFQCYQQAIDHLTIALKKNKKLFDIKSKQFDTKTYHAQILTFLGKCYYETGCYSEALQELNKALKYFTSSSIDTQVLSTKALLLISHCYSKLEDYKKSIEKIEEVIRIFSIQPKQNILDTVMAYSQKSRVQALQQNYGLAMETLEKAINMLTKAEESNPELLAEFYHTLASYQEKLGKIQGQQASLQKIKSIYTQTFSPTDKRVIKIKKEIAMFLFKTDNYARASAELKQTLDLQEKVYGEASPQVVVTLKLLGQISKKAEDDVQAKLYLQKAQKIEQNIRIAENNKNKLKFTAGVKEKKAMQKPIVKEKNDARS